MAAVSPDPNQNGLTIGGRAYHSRYDPQREAEKYLISSKLKESSICLLVAPGKPYLKEAIHRQFSGCRILCLQPAEFRSLMGDVSSEDTWFSDSEIDLPEKLAEWLTEEDTYRVEMLVWPPAWQVFPDFCAACGATIASFIKEADANLRTTAYFGRRWLKNTIDNLLYFPEIHPLPSSTGITLLAGSGPGLGDLQDLLVKQRKKFHLWALPSSLRALKCWGVVPDVVVTSDAGFWAAEHLRYLPTDVEAACRPTLIGPFRAMMRPLWKAPLFVSLFPMGLPLEMELLSARFPQNTWPNGTTPWLDRGTVAATALDLLQNLHSGLVISAGLDFAWKDLHTHVEPHSFHEQKFALNDRLTPIEFRLYAERERQPSTRLASGWRQMNPLDIYQQWMERTGYGKRMTVLDYNPSGLNKGMPTINLHDIRQMLSDAAELPETNLPRTSAISQLPDFKIRIGSRLDDLIAEFDDKRPPKQFSGEIYRALSALRYNEFKQGKIDLRQLNNAVAKFLENIGNSRVFSA